MMNYDNTADTRIEAGPASDSRTDSGSFGGETA